MYPRSRHQRVMPSKSARFSPFPHSLHRAGREGEINEGIDRHMIGTGLECSLQVHLQILQVLSGQGKIKSMDTVSKWTWDSASRRAGEVHRPPSQQSLELSLEGLDPDADPGHPRIPQNAQDGGHHILRVQLHPDALGDDKMRLDGFHHLFQPAEPPAPAYRRRSRGW